MCHGYSPKNTKYIYWVKNLTQQLQSPVEMQVQALVQHRVLKDPTWIQSLAWKLPYAMGMAKD